MHFAYYFMYAIFDSQATELTTELTDVKERNSSLETQLTDTKCQTEILSSPHIYVRAARKSAKNINLAGARVLY